MRHGKAERVRADTAEDLARIIAGCGSDQAIALGSLKGGLNSPATICTKATLEENPGAIARTREYIDYRPGEPAWALIDFDAKGMSDELRIQVMLVSGLWETLLSVAPGLAGAARVCRASTTSAIHRQGVPVGSSGGEHHYLLVKDGGDLKRFLDDLHDRLWLEGLGWIMIGGAGQLLERSLIDRSVSGGERLCFEGAPVVDPPLEQDAAMRAPKAYEGEAIDTALVVPPLTAAERRRVDAAKSAAKAALREEAFAVRSRSDNELANEIADKSGIPLVTAQRLVSARHRGVLLPYLTLTFDDAELGSVSVAEVLAEPDKFIGETLADPLEGIGYGRCKAKVMQGDGGLFIHSFAHGSGVYNLRHDVRSALAELASSAGLDQAMAVWALTDLDDPGDEARFIAAVAKVSGLGKREIRARIAKEKAERFSQARAAPGDDDGRPIHPRPALDGEVTPTVKLLDDLLKADGSSAPPMRDADGKLVAVRVRKPWNMHALASDGSSVASEAPEEPSLVQLTPREAEMLIEGYVRWTAPTTSGGERFVALPSKHLEAYVGLKESSLPVVRAINTAPLVTARGQVIDGYGLDRSVGLFHRIDPQLRTCVPANEITEQDVKNALAFLMDEWLVDVALDPVGKCVAVMLALTLIERPLLKERPAFFVTAGQRGGGKTTLVNMIATAVLGRQAAAAAWSDNAEERKKALFSYLRQGVAAVCWDNITRGSAISCPHIEAALTASEASDRVLGSTWIDTVPATTIQIFTGNALSPKGDMASRSLTLPLKLDRPDPENRAFAHADPLLWTQANRPQIMGALYTLLIAGGRQTPLGQVAKTRFKTWWKLVGWPVEYAAGLLGIGVDCTQLLREGEGRDEEASAVSAALAALTEHWGGERFTTRDVVEAMEPKPGHEFDKGPTKADALREAVAGLAGRRWERPTTHGVGALFKNHLIGRPAWIGGGDTCVVLRAEKDRNGINVYWLE
jgi:hypothetical protein